MGTFSVLIQVSNLEDGDGDNSRCPGGHRRGPHIPGSMAHHRRVRVIWWTPARATQCCRGHCWRITGCVIGKREFVIADGGSRQYDIGVARIAIPGASEERWPCPVIFGPEDQYLVGATTLEAFSLMVDPESALLVPRRHNARPF